MMRMMMNSLEFLGLMELLSFGICFLSWISWRIDALGFLSFSNFALVFALANLKILLGESYE